MAGLFGVVIQCLLTEEQLEVSDLPFVVKRTIMARYNDLAKPSTSPMNTINDIQYQQMQPEDFAAVLQLGNLVHGAGYLTPDSLQLYFERGLAKHHNASFVAYSQTQQLVGFRLAFAAGNWDLDQWCSPRLWPVSPEKVAYFKCNTVSPAHQGGGIGGHLLQLSMTALQQQGAVAGLAHLWQQSPGNAAVKYFSRHGGVLIKEHPDKWRAESLQGYACVRCGFDCHCSAAEMLLIFTATRPTPPKQRQGCMFRRPLP